MAIVRDLETVNAELQEQKERVENVDFKMITFSLAGKDYGVDIMNVKEIAKADKFTYVPNAASYVRGVYNLRGDIIPVIDLRSFFHLPVEKKENGIENMLILAIEDRVYGTIVDKIDKVVGINSESIQPPHPIFGDINIKFISGVVEKQGDLYIILDGVRIFSISEDDKTKSRLPEGGDTYYMPPAYAPPAQEIPGTDISRAESALDFIRQSLPAIKRFYPSSINETWLRSRFADWSIGRQGPELQLKDLEEADKFLARFYSPSTGSFWEDEYATAVKTALPDQSSSNTIQVWNMGCGKGYETFSFACILESKYPDSRFKIWANDNDIMAISQAPNMLFDLDEVPEYCRAHMVRGPNGYTFNQEIKDSILFEYHDVLNDNSLPDLDIILARDVLSFFPVQEQVKLVHEFAERLKTRGLVILGTNEELTEAEWRSMAKRPVSAFTQRE
ncbi:MAG: chemotaxis protein CheW [Spirochaetaceae bacterium]|jgi:purine-binding chemotaxis protein CheW|nr:chemotaxis protein CheW [Spirochaetaceae bacterium]